MNLTLLRNNLKWFNSRNCIFPRNLVENVEFNNRKLMIMCSCSFSNLTYKITSKSCNKYCNNRSFSTESNPPSARLPPLMNFPEIVWPSLFKSIRNFILATFIIKPYFDTDFSIPEFVRGSKKAVEVVSTKLAEGDLKSLNGLVTNDIIPNLQKSVSVMSLAQREQLSIRSEDIYFSFPYQVGIMFPDNGDKDSKRFVEITMVYHALRGLALMRSRGEEPPINMGMLPEFRTRISICNYRFIREYTKGVESDWTINLLNHFKPADYADQ